MKAEEVRGALGLCRRPGLSCLFPIGHSLRSEFPVLELTHHGKDVVDVERVDLDDPLVIDVEIDEIEPVVLLPERLCPILNALELVE